MWNGKFNMVDSPIKTHLQVYKDEQNWSYGQIIFPAGFAGQGILDKDTTFWLDGAKSPPKYACTCVKLLKLLGNQQINMLD